jgi:hypothetical protein
MNLAEAIKIVSENNTADIHCKERPHNQTYQNKALKIVIHFAKTNEIFVKK